MPRIHRDSETDALLAKEQGEDLSIDFNETKLFSPPHIRQCRETFSGSDLDSFKTMMQRSHRLNLDPLTSVWLSEDGTFMLRTHAMFAYAMETGRYAPSSRPSEIEQNDAYKNERNPEGWGRITVWIKLQSKDGSWHEVPGEAYWNDLVPIRDSKRDPLTGARHGGRVDPDSFWASMPFTMLRKNAFADALRRAFPELATFRVEGDRPTQEEDTLAQVAEEVMPAGPREAELEVNWLDGEATKMVPLSRFGKQVASMLAMIVREDPRKALQWFEVNKHAFDDFYRQDAKLTQHAEALAILDIKEMARSAIKLENPDEPATLANPRSRRHGGGVVV